MRSLRNAEQLSQLTKVTMLYICSMYQGVISSTAHSAGW